MEHKYRSCAKGLKMGTHCIGFALLRRELKRLNDTSILTEHCRYSSCIRKVGNLDITAQLVDLVFNVGIHYARFPFLQKRNELGRDGSPWRIRDCMQWNSERGQLLLYGRCERRDKQIERAYILRYIRDFEG